MVAILSQPQCVKCVKLQIFHLTDTAVVNLIDDDFFVVDQNDMFQWMTEYPWAALLCANYNTLMNKTSGTICLMITKI